MSPQPAPRRDSALALICGLLLAVVFTWPLAGKFATAGRLDSGDGRFSVWNVAWVANALTSEPSRVFDANIFFPSPNALAFSEPNLVAGALAAPVWLLTRNPHAASNAAILLSFALSFWTTFLLVRHLTGRRWPAFASAVLFAFNSYVFAHLPHIQLLMTFGLPLAVLALHRFVEAPGGWRAVALGSAISLQALACGYYGIFAGLIAILGLAWFGILHRERRVRYWAWGAFALVLSLALVAPLLPAVTAVHDAGLRRSLDDARLFRAGWRSYLASALLVYQWLLPLLGHWREVLFPGFLSLGLSIVALMHIGRSATPRTSKSPLLVFYVVIAALAAWASVGPDAGLYRWLYEAVPFMDLLRAPSRFGVLVILSVAVLAGFGVMILDEQAAAGRRRLAQIGLFVLLMARSTVGPLSLVDAPAPSRAEVWLSRLPKAGTAQFPINGPSGQRHDQTYYMLQSAWHWQPLINGYSDFTPPEFESVMPALESFPSRPALEALRQRQARYVVVHWNLYGEQERVQVRRTLEQFAPGVRMILDDQHASLYELSVDD